MMTPVTAQGATAAPYAGPWLLTLISIPRPSFGSTWLTHLSSALKYNWLNGDLVDDRFQVPKEVHGEVTQIVVQRIESSDPG